MVATVAFNGIMLCIMSPFHPFLVLENLQIEMCKILMQIDDSNSKKVGAFILPELFMFL